MKQALIPIVVLLVIVTLGIVATWPTSALEANHYQRFLDGKSLYAVLSGRIRRGDSLREVEERLGPAVPVTEGLEELRASLQRDARLDPESWPDGIYDADDFVTYPFENQTLTLQFRNGTLVNHDPTRFAVFRPREDILGRASAGTSVAGKTASPTDETQP